MANRLVLRERRGYPWGNVEARVMWSGGGQDKVWVDSSGIGEFYGSGDIRVIKVAGESIYNFHPPTVNGNTTVTATSDNAH